MKTIATMATFFASMILAVPPLYAGDDGKPVGGVTATEKQTTTTTTVTPAPAPVQPIPLARDPMTNRLGEQVTWLTGQVVSISEQVKNVADEVKNLAAEFKGFLDTLGQQGQLCADNTRYGARGSYSRSCPSCYQGRQSLYTTGTTTDYQQQPYSSGSDVNVAVSLSAETSQVGSGFMYPQTQSYGAGGGYNFQPPVVQCQQQQQTQCQSQQQGGFFYPPMPQQCGQWQQQRQQCGNNHGNHHGGGGGGGTVTCPDGRGPGPQDDPNFVGNGTGRNAGAGTNGNTGAGNTGNTGTVGNNGTGRNAHTGTNGTTGTGSNAGVTSTLSRHNNNGDNAKIANNHSRTPGSTGGQQSASHSRSPGSTGGQQSARHSQSPTGNGNLANRGNSNGSRNGYQQTIRNQPNRQSSRFVTRQPQQRVAPSATYRNQRVQQQRVQQPRQMQQRVQQRAPVQQRPMAQPRQMQRSAPVQHSAPMRSTGGRSGGRGR